MATRPKKIIADRGKPEFTTSFRPSASDPIVKEILPIFGPIEDPRRVNWASGIISLVLSFEITGIQAASEDSIQMSAHAVVKESLPGLDGKDLINSLPPVVAVPERSISAPFWSHPQDVDETAEDDVQTVEIVDQARCHVQVAGFDNVTFFEDFFGVQVPFKIDYNLIESEASRKEPEGFWSRFEAEIHAQDMANIVRGTFFGEPLVVEVLLSHSDVDNVTNRTRTVVNYIYFNVASVKSQLETALQAALSEFTLKLVCSGIAKRGTIRIKGIMQTWKGVSLFKPDPNDPEVLIPHQRHPETGKVVPMEGKQPEGSDEAEISNEEFLDPAEMIFKVNFQTMVVTATTPTPTPPTP